MDRYSIGSRGTRAGGTLALALILGCGTDDRTPDVLESTASSSSTCEASPGGAGPADCEGQSSSQDGGLGREDLASSGELDNRDGRPDNGLDGVRQCPPGTVEPCDTHGALDGRGVCRAGERTCIGSASASSSAWGPCLGAVAPGPRDCASSTDNDCSGIADRVDASCVCIQGATRACGATTCPGVQTCELAADRASTQFGPCVLGPVTFPDPALDTLVRAALPVGASGNQPIDAALVAGLVSLSGVNAGISRLDGLECATSLSRLELTSNLVSDLRPLAGLPLTLLGIQANRVADISVLPSLDRLRLLFIGFNPIADLSPLADVPPLLELELSELPLADLSLLQNQTELIRLDLTGTQVRDLSSLPRVQPSLIYLILTNTPVADLTPALSLDQLSLLEVRGTAVDCLSPSAVELAARIELFTSNCTNL